MVYDFECITIDVKLIIVACALTIESDYPDILESRLENLIGADSVDWLVSRVDYYNRLFKDIFQVNITLEKETETPLTNCFYCKEELRNSCVEDHNHLNSAVRGHAHSNCNPQAENYFLYHYMLTMHLNMIIIFFQR